MDGTRASAPRSRRRALGVALLSALAAASAHAAAGPGQKFRFVVYGGSQRRAQEARAVVARIAALKPQMVAHAGGMVGSSRVTDWREFTALTEPLFQLCPFYGCRGRGEMRAMVAPRDGSPAPRLFGNNYFSFDYRGAHFVFLDTEQRVYRDDPQTRWLAADLASAGTKPIFAFTHRALFGIAERYIFPPGAQWWHPLFVRHKVRVVFSGARHLYHRTFQDGVAYVITGGGGGPLDPVMARRQLTPRDVAGTFNHCVEVTLDGAEIRLRAVDVEGRTRDEFAVRASGPLGEIAP